MATLDPCSASMADIEINVGRAHDNFVASVAGNQGEEVAEKVARLVGILVHLPVGGHHLFAGHEILSLQKIGESPNDANAKSFVA